MPYSIEGWVEVSWCQRHEQVEDYTWQSLIDLSVLVHVADSVSEQLFGLSKQCSSGEIETHSLAANRGVPSSPSAQVKSELEQIREFEKQYGNGDCGGYTYATWQEVKGAPLNAATLEESDWSLVFDLIRSLEQSSRYLDHQIRFVVWFCW